MKYENGINYIGGWKDDLPHTIDDETAKQTWPNGDEYVGQYKNGYMEGHGVYTWADGRMYVGEYLKSERSGKGRCVFEKWDYEGMWKNDQFHGV